MIRATVSMFLISLVAIPPVPVFAQEPASDPELQELLSDIPGEVARFTELHPLPLSEGRQTAGSEEADVGRIRAKARATSVGSDVTITLLDGEEVQGKLAEVAETYFTLRAPASHEARRVHGDTTTIKKKFAFEEVSRLIVGTDPREIKLDRRVEVRLLSGDKVRGRLTPS